MPRSLARAAEGEFVSRSEGWEDADSPQYGMPYLMESLSHGRINPLALYLFFLLHCNV